MISALQARNNARIVFVGSLDFFSDNFFQSPVKQKSDSKVYDKSGNEELATSLSKWVFKEEGVLRVSTVDHFIKGDKTAPEYYTIMDDAEFWITIETFKNGQ